MVKRSKPDYQWDGVPVHPYKEDGTLFKDVTRQTLFHGGHDLAVEFRYFEVGVGGHTTLERHQHAHLVTVIRGRGRALVGGEVSDISIHDVVQVPPLTWHQFQAASDEPLGFLCIVNPERDRPQRPGPDELAELNANAEVAAFIKT